MNKIIVTTEKGILHLIDDLGVKNLYNPNDGPCMGLTMNEKFIYIASEFQIYKINKVTLTLVSKSKRFNRPRFHQMNLYDGCIYMTHTSTNSIIKFDTDLKVISEYKIPPPFPKRPAAHRHNYNHINSVVKNSDRFYINLNTLINNHGKPKGYSGVSIVDENFIELERIKLGWESHDLQFMGNDMILLCASSKKNGPIAHPGKAGLMVNGELVFEHDPNEVFCKGLTYDDAYIYLCGGTIGSRENRKYGQGVIYILDRNDYSLVEVIKPLGVNNIKGVMMWEGLK